MSSKKIEIENHFEIAKKVATRYGFSTPSDFVPTKVKKIKIYKSTENIGERKAALCELLGSYIRSDHHKEKKIKFIFHSNIDKESSKYINRSSGLKTSQISLSSIGLNDPLLRRKLFPVL